MQAIPKPKADDYDLVRNIGFALAASIGGSDQAYAKWREWGAPVLDGRDEALRRPECKRLWATFQKTPSKALKRGPITAGTLIRYAKANGWRWDIHAKAIFDAYDRECAAWQAEASSPETIAELIAEVALPEART